MQNLEKCWLLQLNFLKTVGNEQFMNFHELFANIAIYREQMALITKFIHNQINKRTLSMECSQTNIQTANPGICCNVYVCENNVCCLYLPTANFLLASIEQAMTAEGFAQKHLYLGCSISFRTRGASRIKYSPPIQYLSIWYCHVSWTNPTAFICPKHWQMAFDVSHYLRNTVCMDIEFSERVEEANALKPKTRNKVTFKEGLRDITVCLRLQANV